MADDNRWSDRDRDWRDDRTYTEPGMDRSGRWSRGGYGAGRGDYGEGGRASPGYNPAGPAQNSGFDRGYGYYEDQDYRARDGGEQNYRAARAYQEGDPGFPAYGGQGRRGYQGSGGYEEARFGSAYGSEYGRNREAYGQGYSRRPGDYDYGPYTPYGAITEGETSSDYDRARPWRGDGGYRREGYRGDDYRGDGRRPGEHRSWLERTGEKLGHFVRDLGREGGDRYHDGLTADDHGGRGPKGYRRSDERIREDVSDRFTEDRYLDATNIGVTVEGGEVTLDGTVTSRQAKRHAEDVAERVSGVTHVQNNLRVKDDRASETDAIIDGAGVIPEV